MSDQAPNQVAAPAPEPGPSPLRRMLRESNDLTLDGPKPPDVGDHAGSSSMAIDRVGALEKAQRDGVLFMKGAQLDDLGSEALKGAGVTGSQTPDIKAVRLSAKSEEAEVPTEPPVLV